MRGLVGLGRGSDIWHKPALSAVVAMGIPNLLLLGLGRLDLAMYTAAGAMCVLYAHGLPYAARARTLIWVILGMTATTGAGLLTAAATDSTAVRVAVAALLAAVHKVVCDATRIGMPGNLIFTFIGASCLFFPQQFVAIPLHLDLTLAGGLLAWVVCMAPALVRPRGPERTAVARALEAAARLVGTAEGEPGHARARHAAAAAVNAAWHTVLLVPVPTPERAADRYRLELLLARAESGTAAPRQLAVWARALRRNIPLPDLFPPGREADQVAGVAVEQAAVTAMLRRHAPDRPHVSFLHALRPGSPLLPIGARVAIGCALAGWASMALGVGRPYWAVVTAAAVFQANMALSWGRAVHRALGNFLGLAVFAALLPVTRTGALAVVLVALFFQFGAEATISRGYWLGAISVTNLSLLMTEFVQQQPARELFTDRALDTVVGVVIGLLCCALVTNRRAAGRTEQALESTAAAHEAAERLVAQDKAAPQAHELAWARDRLAGALLELREAADTVAGEWWQPALPEEQIATAEREGHQLLAELARRLDPVHVQVAHSPGTATHALPA
ncbi:FUSC family protein [Streptomyces sp. NPDC002577]